MITAGYTKIELGSDITKIRTNIASSLKLFKNKHFMGQFAANLLGSKLTPEAKKDMASRIEANITANSEPSVLENIIEKYKTKIFDVNLLLSLGTEFFYALKVKEEKEALVLIDILKSRLIALGLSPDYSNFKEINANSLTEDESQDNPHFDYVFALTLRQTALQTVNNFLNYQQSRYEGDFRAFLEICLKEYEPLLNPKTIEITKKWLATASDIPDEKSIKNQKKIIVSLPKVRRDKDDNITVLKADQTVYLALFLKEARIILKDNTYQTNAEIAKALQVMTGYSAESMRQVMSTPIEKIDKKDLRALKTNVENLLSFIKKHL